ncbi:hypothetical protein JCM12141A_28320 [Mycolicibacterium hodleri]
MDVAFDDVGHADAVDQRLATKLVSLGKARLASGVEVASKGRGIALAEVVTCHQLVTPSCAASAGASSVTRVCSPKLRIAIAAVGMRRAPCLGMCVRCFGGLALASPHPSRRVADLDISLKPDALAADWFKVQRGDRGH